MLKRLAVAGVLAGLALPAAAGEAGDILRRHLYSGDLAGGLTALEPYVEQQDTEGLFGYGMIQFVQAVEHLAQALYRHGLAAPETGAMGPALVVPVQPNPNPQPLTYEGVRQILEPLVPMFETASEHLHDGGANGEWVVKLDPTMFRIDVDGNGTAEETETVAAVMARVFGASPEPGAPMTPEQTKPDTRSGRATEPARPAVAEPGIGFDRADSIWLAGYSQIMLAHLDFLLAHDFSDFVNVSFHRIFPKAGFPMQDFATGGTLVFEPGTDTAIADAIAAVHTIHWPVTEPERLKRVRERALTVLQYSRENWDAILAETDDNVELVPSPRQTSLDPQLVVTDEVVAAWMATLASAERVLNGELLLPHWRFKQGFDLKAYFETAKRTDLVLLLSGSDAVAYIKPGPIVTAADFAEGNRVFGDNFFNYIFWFN